MKLVKGLVEGMTSCFVNLVTLTPPVMSGVSAWARPQSEHATVDQRWSKGESERVLRICV